MLKIAARIRRVRVPAMQIRISVDDIDDAKTISTLRTQKNAEVCQALRLATQLPLLAKTDAFIDRFLDITIYR